MDSKRADTGRRAGLNQEKIMQAAKELTRTQGLEGWSIRDLALHLGVVPSVLYHHYENRDAVVAAVIEEITSNATPPSPELPWKDWFMALALQIRPILLEYPGVTDRLMYGQINPGLVKVLDASFQKLHEAGFRRYAPLAYTMIINTILWTITARNLRSPTKREQRHDLNQMIARMQPLTTNSEALTDMLQNYLVPLANPENENQMSQEYFEITVEALLNGLESTVLPKEQQV